MDELTCNRVRELVESCGKSWAVVITDAPDQQTQFVTWGKSAESKVYASNLGEYIAGDLCGDVPVTVHESFHGKAEAAKNKAEVERLSALLEEFAAYAQDSGWHGLAVEIRRRSKGG